MLLFVFFFFFSLTPSDFPACSSKSKNNFDIFALCFIPSLERIPKAGWPINLISSFVVNLCAVCYKIILKHSTWVSLPLKRTLSRENLTPGPCVRFCAVIATCSYFSFHFVCIVDFDR